MNLLFKIPLSHQGWIFIDELCGSSSNSLFFHPVLLRLPWHVDKKCERKRKTFCIWTGFLPALVCCSSLHWYQNDIKSSQTTNGDYCCHLSIQHNSKNLNKALVWYLENGTKYGSHMLVTQCRDPVVVLHRKHSFYQGKA